MNSVLALALVVGVGASDPATSATDPAASTSHATEVVAERVAAPAVAPVLTRIEAPTRVEHQAEAVATPPRGSFWWTVGAIVVAGVILAVIL